MDTTIVTHEFYEQVRRDHQTLLRRLAEAERLVARPEMTVSQASEVFMAMGKAVETHFQEEEQSGCFERVAADAPQLADRAQALCGQHAELLAAANELAAEAVDGDGSPEWRSRLSAEFNRFQTMLFSHEAAENTLLEDAYNLETGLGD